jgi:hypothetical protein
MIRAQYRDTAIAATFALATIVWSLIAGKDINWDVLNYHYYAGYALLTDRLQQDFMAANQQSYLSPFAYVPFYLMVKHGWNSIVIASVLATFHSINAFLAYRITRLAVGEQTDNVTALAILGATLTFLSPIYLLEAGSTFADITTAVFVLCALWLLLLPEQASRWGKHALLAGLCLGAAAGLKVTNVVFCVGIASALLLARTSWHLKARDLALLSFGACITVLLTHGYWSWRLWQEFGNPMFPMMNALFQSNDYPLIDHRHERFMVTGLLDAITLPFRMAQLRSWVYVEPIAPDLRFAAATLLAIGAVGAALVRRIRKPEAETTIPESRAGALFLAFAVSFALWLLVSANGRYGIAVGLLCGPVVATLAARVVTVGKGALILLVVLSALQAFHYAQGQPRYSAYPWTSTWFEASVPAKLIENPYLYISVDHNSNSYLAPFLAPESAFTNPHGQVSIELDGPGGERLKRLLKRYQGRTRVITAAAVSMDSPMFPSVIQLMDDTIGRLNLAVDPTDCEQIRTAGPPGLLTKRHDEEQRRHRSLLTCKVIPHPYARSAERAAAHRVFQKAVDWCPMLFKPDQFVVEYSPTGWATSFADSDVALRIEDGVLLLLPHHAFSLMELGKIDNVVAHGVQVPCADFLRKPELLFQRAPQQSGAVTRLGDDRYAAAVTDAAPRS